MKPSLNCTLQPGSAASLKDFVEMKVSSPTVSKNSSTGSVKVKVKFISSMFPTVGSKTVLLERVSPYRLAQLFSRRMLQTCKDLLLPPMTTDHVYILKHTWTHFGMYLLLGLVHTLIFIACTICLCITFLCNSYSAHSRAHELILLCSARLLILL